MTTATPHSAPTTACTPTRDSAPKVAPTLLLHPSSSRAVGLDVARLIASLGVIWLHAFGFNPWAVIGHFRIPFFTIISTYLLATSILKGAHERRLLTYTRDRFTRLYLPFLAWSCIYLLLYTPTVLAGFKPGLPDYLTVYTVGGSYHLWFLPFILTASLITFILVRILARLSQRCLLGLALTATPICLLIFAVPPAPFTHPDVIIFNTWIEYFGCIGFGIILAILLHLYTPGRLLRYALAIGGTMVWIFRITLDLWARDRLLDLHPEYLSRAQFNAYIPDTITLFTDHFSSLSALGLTIAALMTFDYRWLKPLAALGRLSYGSYLSHLLFTGGLTIFGLNRFGPRLFAFLTNFDLDPQYGIYLTRFLIAAAGSLLLAHLLTRSRWTCWLVGQSAPRPSPHTPPRHTSSPSAGNAFPACTQ